MTDPQNTINFPEASATQNVLTGIACLESRLGAEIARLRSQCLKRSPGNSQRRCVASFGGKPLWWWWWAMLVSWTHAPATRRALAGSTTWTWLRTTGLR